MFIPGDPEAGRGETFQFGVPLPPGDYDCVVLDVEERNSQAGNPMLALILGVKGPNGGVKLFDYRTMTPKAMFFFYQMLRGLWPEALAEIQKAGQEGGNAELDVYQLEGRKGRIRTIVDEFKGKEGPKVDAYLPHPTAAKILDAVPVADNSDASVKCPF